MVKMITCIDSIEGSSLLICTSSDDKCKNSL